MFARISNSISYFMYLFVQKEREGRAKKLLQKTITKMRSTRTITNPSTILRNTGNNFVKGGRRKEKLLIGRNGKKKKLRRIRPRLREKLEGAKSKGLFRTMR